MASVTDFEMPRMPRKNKTADDPKMIGLWKIGRTIGQGSSGACLERIIRLEYCTQVVFRSCSDCTTFEDRPIRCYKDSTQDGVQFSGIPQQLGRPDRAYHFIS